MRRCVDRAAPRPRSSASNRRSTSTSERGDEAQSLQLEIAHLKEQLANRTKALFGDTSERRTGGEPKVQEPKQPKSGHGPREQRTLPIVEVVHERDEPDQACPSCGGDLEPMADQFEEADEIDVVERSFRVVRHKRQKYRGRFGAEIETALGPDKLVAGGLYSIDFAVNVAIAKFADPLPLERQVRQMARDGLDVDSSTLWEQTRHLSRHLLPTYEANHAHVLSADVIAEDETWWRLMKKAGRNASGCGRSLARMPSAIASCLRVPPKPRARCSTTTRARPSATATRCMTCRRGNAKVRT
jgi:transposase